jgi:2-phosphoglycolate phosphatase
MKIDSLFLDLDGTLLDTAPDLFLAIKVVLEKYHFPSISYDNFRPSVEAGTRGMIKHAFNITEQHSDYHAIIKDFLNYYQAHIAEKTVFFPGMDDFLTILDERRIVWGIVTNKPEFLARPLLQHFKLENRCKAMVCGDTLPTRKPDPAPLRYACELVQADPKNSVYIGDTQSDMVAAKAADMFAIAVSFGYNLNQSSPSTWSADFIANSARDLQNWLELR